MSNDNLYAISDPKIHRAWLDDENKECSDYVIVSSQLVEIQDNEMLSSQTTEGLNIWFELSDGDDYFNIDTNVTNVEEANQLLTKIDNIRIALNHIETEVKNFMFSLNKSFLTNTQ